MGSPHLIDQITHASLLSRMLFFVALLSYSLLPAQTNSWEKLNQQGEELYGKGEYDKALEIFLKAKPVAEKEFGKSNASYATACDNLAFMHMMLGHYAEAEPLFLESKSIREKTPGKNTVEYATTCVNMADLYNAQGLYPKAEALYLEAMDIFKKVPGESSNEYALVINNLAGLYFTLGDYKKTEEFYLTARAIWIKTDGKESQNYATSCNNLGSLYQQLGDYHKAEALYIESKTIQEKVTGKNAPEYATACNNLGDLYREDQDHTRAEPLYLEALEIRKRVYGEAHPNYAQSLLNVGLLYVDLGQYNKAEHLLIKSRDVYLKAVGKDHPDYAGICNELAVLYRFLGNYTKAEKFYLEALDVNERALGKNHSNYAQTCNDLAGFYRTIGEYDKSESLYLESKKIRADIYGKETPTYGASCNNLGLLYYAKGDYAKAEPLYQEAFEIIKKKSSSDNPGYGKNRSNLAQLYSVSGKGDKAEPLFKEAKENYDRTIGKSHPDYSILLNNFGSFYSDQGQFEKAEPLFNEAKEIQLRQIGQNFQTLSEKEQQKYYLAINFYFANYANFIVKYYPQKNTVAGDLYNLRLITKGLIFNSAVKTRLKILASGDTSLLHKYESLRTLRNFLAKSYSMSSAERTRKNIDPRQLEEQANAVEKDLVEAASKLGLGYKERANVTWQNIKAKLKKKEAAVEIVRIPLKKDTIYIAVVLKNGEGSIPEIITLEHGKILEGRSIHYYRNCIQNLVEDLRSYDTFWKPIASKLQGVKKIYFSADGVYHQINLATLKNPGSKKYLSDEWNIQLVGSTRELAEAAKIPKAVKAELFGYPDYKGDGKNTLLNSESNNNRGYTPPTFSDELTEGFARFFDQETGVPALPGTAIEVNSIEQMLKEHNIPTDLYTGSMASEQQIKLLKNPKILHIATHGFFLPVTKKGKIVIEDQFPLLRSGLLLAGCEKSMRGNTPSEGEDGILTAYEAMNLFLDETDLVVLSACETGLGDEQNGDVVYGLQQAFQEAGARTLLISLWRVDDKATQLLMTNFYKEYLRTGKAKESFDAAQKEVRSKYPQPYYWGAFVMVGLPNDFGK